MEIEKLDKNFAVDAEIDKTGLKFYSVDDEPFRIYGVQRVGDIYQRMPTGVAETVSPGVASLCKNTAGGRVRFLTDSKRIAISARLDGIGFSDHMAFTAKAGFDLYENGSYRATFRPPVAMKNYAYESLQRFGSDGEKLVTVNMPLYGGVRELLIGLDEGATLRRAPDYTYEKPIVFYGSSITQGGCASRSGTSYQAWLSREFDFNFINLGFSGNAKGEPNMAKYIASLDMSAFVFDYDHNATSVEALAATHEPFFKTVRAAQPDIPIIVLSAPKFELDEYRQKTRDVIKRTCDNARAAGDEKVIFVDGNSFFDEIGNEGTVDGTHPTDLGFYCMAKGISTALEKFFKKA